MWFRKKRPSSADPIFYRLQTGTGNPKYFFRFIKDIFSWAPDPDFLIVRSGRIRQCTWIVKLNLFLISQLFSDIFFQEDDEMIEDDDHDDDNDGEDEKGDADIADVLLPAVELKVRVYLNIYSFPGAYWVSKK